MTKTFSCPYCGVFTVEANSNSDLDHIRLLSGSDLSHIRLESEQHICGNPTCKKNQISVNLVRYGNANYDAGMKVLGRWNLLPSSSAKPQPDYIPRPIVMDYNEACAIAALSPKASATLSRRCLQGMIRDFFGISKSTLYEEINALQDLIAPDLWDAINGVRQIGNIGAHMEKDINIIVDVDESEAQILIELIELLIKEWYVHRFNQQSRISKVHQIAKDKLIPKVATDTT